MNDAPVGVFDSGVGGLTVLRALMHELPHERFIYLGDTARLPYGTKSAQTIERYAQQAAGVLIAHGVKCLVVACNTASALGLPAIRRLTMQLPVVGVIEPGAAAAAAASLSGCIAVIATESTVRGGAYHKAIIRYRGDAQVTELPTQLLVALAEEGLHEGPIAEAVARHYLGPLFDPGAHPDTLVLGCTHFPMLMMAIVAAVGSQIRIVDSAATTAATVRAQLAAGGLQRESGHGSVMFLATDSPERFARVGSRFLGREIAADQVQLIDSRMGMAHPPVQFSSAAG